MFYSPIQATCCLPSVSVTSGLHAGLPYIPQSPHLLASPCSVHSLLISSLSSLHISPLIHAVFTFSSSPHISQSRSHFPRYSCSVHSLGAVFTVSSSPHVSMQCSQSPHLLRSPCSVHRLHISSQFTVSSFPHVSMQCSQSPRLFGYPFNQKNFNHPTRGNFVVVMAGSLNNNTQS